MVNSHKIWRTVEDYHCDMHRCTVVCGKYMNDNLVDQIHMVIAIYRDIHVYVIYCLKPLKNIKLIIFWPRNTETGRNSVPKNHSIFNTTH
jgi:hypothetical protein